MSGEGEKVTANPRDEIGRVPDSELVKELLIENYGYAPDLVYEIRGRYHKVYAWKPCPLEVKGPERQGVYFARIESDGIRLSIEGSFLVGPKATKNVMELDDERARRYLAGESVEIEDRELHGWVIVKWRSYFLGSAKAKEGKLINYVPGERRLRLDS
ncbi:methyltransferase RsmF C-terminal domain-like protein [Thermococcus sp.]